MGDRGEGVSAWKQRQAAKAMMYATSNEQSGAAISARRQLNTGNKYAPHVNGWKGQAWGLASTKMSFKHDLRALPRSTRPRTNFMWILGTRPRTSKIAHLGGRHCKNCGFVASKGSWLHVHADTKNQCKITGRSP